MGNVINKILYCLISYVPKFAHGTQSVIRYDKYNSTADGLCIVKALNNYGMLAIDKTTNKQCYLHS